MFTSDAVAGAAPNRPATVCCAVALADGRTSKADIRVLAAIAASMSSTRAVISYTEIARDAGIDRTTAVRSVRRLLACGYLDRESGDCESPNTYRLTSQGDVPTPPETGGTEA